MPHDDDSIDWNSVPPAKMFHLVMQELVDVRNELRQEFKDGMASMKTELKADIAKLDGRVGRLESEVHTLRLEVHQNQTTFMANHASLDRRVTALEMAA
jgi:hypothetical protein